MLISVILLSTMDNTGCDYVTGEDNDRRIENKTNITISGFKDCIENT